MTGVLRWFVISCFLAASASRGVAEESNPQVLLVVGAPGEAEYSTNFLQEASLWQSACKQAGVCSLTLGTNEPAATNDCEALRQAIETLPKDGLDPLWLILIGHGTFDGKDAWFNLRGPDVSATQLAQWLTSFRRPLVLVDTSASSGPFLNKLSATNRVIVTATRSGNEQSYARFGEYFARTLTDSQADLDHDGQVSVLESFLTASHEVSEFYKSKGRLMSEHALIDDNGDGLGTPADWFRGLRATKKAKDGSPVDGALAQQFRLIPSPAERSLTPEQLAQRDAIERKVLALREKKSSFSEDAYYQELEALLVQLARFYAANMSTNAVQNP